MMKEVYFQWLTKSDPNVSVAALALANVLQVASTKLAVFSKSLLLNVSIAVHVLVLVLQAQSKLNNLQHKKVSLHSLFFVCSFPTSADSGRTDFRNHPFCQAVQTKCFTYFIHRTSYPPSYCNLSKRKTHVKFICSLPACSFLSSGDNCLNQI